MTHPLVAVLEATHQDNLVPLAQTLVAERDQALADVFATQFRNEQLWKRLREVIAERNDLKFPDA